MGIKRVVDTSFWTDGKIDAFSAEDKYFMLYLLTNPFTTQLGIYEISIKQAAFQLGYSKDSVNVLLDRFASKYGVIFYTEDPDGLTVEIAIKNFLRHSIIKGGAPVRDCLIKEMSKVKNKELIAKVFTHIKGNEDLNETVKNIIDEYEKKNGILNYSNEKQNENENENDVSYHDSYNDTCNESFSKSPKVIDYQDIVNLFNSICVSLPSVRSLSTARKKAIKARLNTYTIDDFKLCFENAEASAFLKGGNNRNWTATFDWLIKDTNMAKVLDGNYADKTNNNPNKSYDTDDFFEAAVARSWEDAKKENPPKTAGNDPAVKEKAEALIEKIKQGV